MVVVCHRLKWVVCLLPRWFISMLCRTTHVNTMSLTTFGLCSMVVNSTLNLLTSIPNEFSTTLLPLDILYLAILSSPVSRYLLYGLTSQGIRAQALSPAGSSVDLAPQVQVVQVVVVPRFHSQFFFSVCCG